MFRISQRFAACFTALVAALGVFAALPFAPTQHVIASNVSKARATTFEGAARDALRLHPRLHARSGREKAQGSTATSA